MSSARLRAKAAIRASKSPNALLVVTGVLGSPGVAIGRYRQQPDVFFPPGDYG